MAAMVSATEIMAVHDGIRNDIREDGRTLLQRRPVELSCTRSVLTGARGVEAGGSGDDGAVAHLDEYSGSRVEARIADTVVLAASTPTVVEIAAEGELDAVDDGAARDARCRGQLFISIDAAPHVVDYYARAMGGRSTRYRRSFLSYLAHHIRSVFGAESVSAQEQLGGVVEAQLLDGEDENESDGEGEEADREGQTANKPDLSAGAPVRGLATGFPAQSLYIGKHFAFRLDVDVHVLEAGGGNLLSAVAIAVHAALVSCKLPSVTLHEASTGSSVSLEVDKSKPYARSVDWTQLPMLCVLHVSPTGHYLVDPTQREALALPQQLHVAATGRGLICFSRYQQWPSRRGARLVPQAEVGKTGGVGPAPGTVTGGKRDREGEEGEQDTAASLAASGDVASRGAAQVLEGAESLMLRDRNVAIPPMELPLSDYMAAVSEAVYACQAMIADCQAQLGSS